MIVEGFNSHLVYSYLAIVAGERKTQESGVAGFKVNLSKKKPKVLVEYNVTVLGKDDKHTTMTQSWTQ